MDWDKISPTQFGGPEGDQYTAPNGKTYVMGRGDFLEGGYAARTPSGRRAAAMTTFRGSEPEEHTIHDIYVSKPHRGKGLATALLDYARATDQPDLHHSSALTNDGKKFAAATPRPWQPKLDPTGHYAGGLSDENPMRWDKTINYGPVNRAHGDRFEANLRDRAYERSQAEQAAQFTQQELF